MYNFSVDPNTFTTSQRDIAPRPFAWQPVRMTVVLCVLVASCVQGAIAENAAPGDSASGGQLEEVVVTARKRNENLENVPVAITAISAEDLGKDHIQTIEDLASTVPGLSVAHYGSAGTNNPTIRGITSQYGTSTVGIYLNDTPVAGSTIINGNVGQPDLILFDMSRLEVLKGPQGTLYGASSLGGTIKYVTAEPALGAFTQEYGADVSSTDHAGGLNYLAKAVVNVPVSDQSAALIGIQYTSDAGYINHLAQTPVAGYNVGTTTPLRHSNWQDSLAIHAAFAAHFTDQLVVTPSLLYQRYIIGDASLFDDGGSTTVTTRRIVEPHSDQVALPAVLIQADLGWASLTSSTSYFDRLYDSRRDYTNLDSGYQGYLAQLAEGSGEALIGNLLSEGFDHDEFKSYTEEVRLSSPNKQRLTWLVGAFYDHGDTTSRHTEYSYGTNAATEQLYGLTPLDVFGTPFPNDINYYYATHEISKESALFGQVAFDITNKLNVAFGERYFADTLSNETVQSGFYATPTNPPGGTSTTGQSTRSTGTTPKLTVSYQYNESTLFFADAAKGFRLGGTQPPVPQNLCAADLAALGLTSSPTSYKPDTTWNYELGYKGQLFDRHLIVDVSAFDIRWNGIQQSILLPTCFFGWTANVGKAESKGFDVAIKARPIEDLLLSMNFGYTDATFLVANPAFGVAVGDRTLYTPKTTSSVSAEYTIAKFNLARITGRVNASNQSQAKGHLAPNLPNEWIPGYSLFGAQLALEEPRWRAEIFGKNLANMHRDIGPYQGSYWDHHQNVTAQPRTIGIGFDYKF